MHARGAANHWPALQAGSRPGPCTPQPRTTAAAARGSPRAAFIWDLDDDEFLILQSDQGLEPASAKRPPFQIPCQPTTPPQPRPTLPPRRRTPRTQQNKARSPSPCRAPRSINLCLPDPMPAGAPQALPGFPAFTPRPDPAAPSCVRHVHTDPHAGVPLRTRPSPLRDSEAGGCPLDPTSDSSSTRPCSGCRLLVNLKAAALPGAETEQRAAARRGRNGSREHVSGVPLGKRQSLSGTSGTRRSRGSGGWSRIPAAPGRSG